MKILHLTTYESGGAGRAVSRLHQGLIDADVDSQMLVQKNVSNRPSIHQNPISDKMRKLRMSADVLPSKLYRNRLQGRASFSTQWLPDSVHLQVAQMAPSVVNLHWLNHGFVQIESLAKLAGPIVWTLHDMWPFTGGCHYSEACDVYQSSCGRCPRLQSSRQTDLSSWVWHRKLRVFRQAHPTIISPSHWLADCARKSSLFRYSRVEVVPHGIDLDTYSPVEKSAARLSLGLPSDKQLILFGALNATQNKRKGFHLLLSALRSYIASNPDKQDCTNLVVFGSDAPGEPLKVGYKMHYLGKISDEKKLRLAYSAADVMIVPSLQEAFGQTASESIACGTPVVAFDATGLKDIIYHKHTGYLAKPFDFADLAKGISWVLEDCYRHLTLCENAREVAVKEFSLVLQAYRYLSIYKDILAKTTTEHSI